MQKSNTATGEKYNKTIYRIYININIGKNLGGKKHRMYQNI